MMILMYQLKNIEIHYELNYLTQSDLMFLDGDEYLTLNSYDNIHDFLYEQLKIDNFNTFLFNWKMISSNNLIKHMKD